MNEVALPQDPVPLKDFEGALLRYLSSGSISDDHARALVSELSGLDVLRSYPLRPFPKGIIGPDGLGLQLVLDREGLRKLSAALLDAPHLDKFEYFPYGIIDPQVFVSRIEFRL